VKEHPWPHDETDTDTDTDTEADTRANRINAAWPDGDPEAHAQRRHLPTSDFGSAAAVLLPWAYTCSDRRKQAIRLR